MHFVVTWSYTFVAMSNTLETKLEAVHERTDETERVTSHVLSLLDIVMGVYFSVLSICCKICLYRSENTKDMCHGNSLFPPLTFLHR